MEIILTHFENLESLSKWIKESTPREISYWADNVIKQDIHFIPQEMRLWIPEEVLYTVYRSSDDVLHSNKIKQAITIISNNASWMQFEPEYLSTLLATLGYLNVQQNYVQLSRLARKKILVDRFLKPGVSLHRHLLACLAGLGCNENSVDIFLRDVREEEYAGICYRALWAYNPRIAIGVSKYIVQLGIENENYPSKLLLKEFVSNVSLDLAWELVSEIVGESALKRDYRIAFSKMVERGTLGVKIIPEDNHYKLLRDDNQEKCLLLPSNEVLNELVLTGLRLWLEPTRKYLGEEGEKKLAALPLPFYIKYGQGNTNVV